MTPYEQAREVYAKEPCARTFEVDLRHHLLAGFVFSTPEFFIMGRPVIKGSNRDWIVNPEYRFARKDCDCWHVYLMAGNPSAAWSIMPWPLPWFSFERRNDLRFYESPRIQRLSLGAHDLPQFPIPA